MDTNKLERARAKARQKLRELEALAVLGNLMTSSSRAELERHKAELNEKATIKRVQELVHSCDQRLTELRDLLGAKIPNGRLVELLRFIETAPAGKALFVRKSLFNELFAHPERTYKPFESVPAHAMVLAHLTKPDRHIPPEVFDWKSVEATLFEDMCSLFNLATDKNERAGAPLHGLRAKKEFDALLRAATSTTLYFVEAYLNGLAYDHYFTKKDKLDEDSKKKLTEWDEKRSRPSYLSLREKLLQYPRIILGQQHPPLNESNCPEISFLCGRAKLLRDSIVHASPQPDQVTLEPFKETILFNPDFGEVQKLVDNAVSLVRKVELAVQGSDAHLSWMQDRGPDGFFPKEVFL